MAAHAVLNTANRLKLIPANTYTGHFINGIIYKIQACGYAKKPTMKGKGKGMTKEVLTGPEVCKDPVQLTTHAVGVNIFKEGQDPALRPVEEYPEWLFKLNLGPPPKLEDLHPETRQYWRVVRKQHMWRFNRLHQGKRF
ncbi:large ribosomal subunit protein mL54 [Conger conger]|uniref:large ribosomal subunit protein mL54 n=1 Tax=Conger conger TaxID=82655 RepID=UPI002A599636|nr:large ribosomal subunit protein mL54 [Conger conger]